MNKTILWFDADGVLLDFYTPFKEFCGVDPEFQGQHYDMRDLEHNHCTIDMDKIIADFIQSEQYSQLDPMALITHLESLKNCGFELRVITQCAMDTTLASRLARIHNLSMQYGGVFSGIHFVEPGDSKVKYIENMDKELTQSTRHILIEDSPYTLIECYEYSHRHGLVPAPASIIPVCIRHSYNEQHLAQAGLNSVNLVMVHDVQELTELLLGGHVCQR